MFPHIEHAVTLLACTHIVMPVRFVLLQTGAVGLP